MRKIALIFVLLFAGCSADIETGVTEGKNFSEDIGYLAKVYAEYSAGVGTSKESAAGFLWKKNDKYYIVTCGHLLSDKSEPEKWKAMATLKDKSETLIKLKLIRISADPDVGLFVVDDPNFKYEGFVPSFGDSSNLSETLYALGHPDGKMNVTSKAKLVASDYRTEGMKTPMICHVSTRGHKYRHVGQGSSGGPLLNEGGEVVGIHVGMLDKIKIDNKDATFAVATPSNTAKKLIDEWLK